MATKRKQQYGKSRAIRLHSECDEPLDKLASSEDRDPVYYIRKYVREGLQKEGKLKLRVSK